jgi:hypothetical protein
MKNLETPTAHQICNIHTKIDINRSWRTLRINQPNEVKPSDISLELPNTNCRMRYAT